MTTPIEVRARVAATPEQAKVWVSLLQANGIPARVDGDTLVDEFAASRRLMNLMGVDVMVPTGCAGRARELLEPLAIDVDELTRQALAAGESGAPADAALRFEPVQERPRRWLWWLLLGGPFAAPLVLWIALRRRFR